MEKQPFSATPTTSASAGRFRYVIVGLVFIGGLILWGDRVNIAVAAPVIAKHFSWGPVIIGSILSAFTFGYWLLQIPGGRFADYQPKQVAGWGAVWWSVFTALTTLGVTPFLMLTMRVLVGVGEGPFAPATTGIISRWLLPSERGKSQALNGGTSLIGPVVFFPISGWLVSRFGWQSPFWAYAVLGLLWAAAWFMFVTDWPEQHGKVASHEAAQIAAGRGERSGTLPMRPVLRDRTAWGLILAYFAYPYSFFMVTGWIPTMLVSKFHVSVFHAGFLAALPDLVGFVMCFIGGALVDAMISHGTRCGAAHKVVICSGYILCAVAMYLITVDFVLGWVEFWLSVAIGGLGATLGVFWSLAIYISPRRASGISGAMNFAGITGGLLSPYITGWIVALTGSFIGAFLLASIILVVCAGVFFILVRSGDPALAGEEVPAAAGRS